MLQDFIESNNLQARILPCSAKGSLIKCRLFSCSDFDVLVIFFARDKISKEKVKTSLNSDSAQRIENSEIEEITGYMAEFLPPISIYGVKVLLDRKVAKAERVMCLVSDKKTLEKSPNEIREANDNALIADITI